MFDKIKPTFCISDENQQIIEKIDILLQDLEIKDKVKRK